jgi:dimethylargininase
MKHAIVRTPCSRFAEGLSTAGLGVPDLALAVRQHERYAAALEGCGLTLLRLGPDRDYPDSCFVEDVAVLTDRGFLLTRPGAESRRGEVDPMHTVLSRFQDLIPAIQPPGILDGGDVCQVEDHFFIGISSRTNFEGASQLGGWLEDLGYSYAVVDLDGLGLLHLKSGMAYLGDGRLAMIDDLSRNNAFGGYELVRLPPHEHYAANSVRLNDRVLIASGFPKFEAALRKLGYDVATLDMSEFQKMDGGLSCLSLRW